MIRIKVLLMSVLPVSALAQSDTAYRRFAELENAIEYENGVPVREWEKIYGEFRLKE